MAIEVWKGIAEFENYEVSDKGRVRRLRGSLLKQELHKGYLYVCLYSEGRRRRRSVSRLVAAAFLPNPLLLPEVNHNHGNKLDNRASELSWTTSQGNKEHAVKLGLVRRGQRRAKAREVRLEVVLRIKGSRITIVR
jgi:hypothetical protein